ncbi:MAG TPA: ABC1 kinase family protein [Ktedonobacterales bacterium]|nr:ABC1 kinase family protein [Ktedonobacterales bacterium]
MGMVTTQVRAVEQAVRDTRAMLTDRAPLRDPLLLGVRLGDLARSSGFLWMEGYLKTIERYSRRAHLGRRQARGLALMTLAVDLLSGYTLLAQRQRLPGRLTRAQDWAWQHQRSADRLRDTAAALQGTLIKAAQFASTRPDILPAPYIRALATLQDRVPAQPWPEMRRAITRELGRPPEAVFQRIETRPIASASIAQVHRAELPDGRQVAVKIQYPGIQGVMHTDLTILQWVVTEVARLAPALQLQPILDHLRDTLPLELDFVREAAAMTTLRAALAHRADVLVPAVIPELSTRRLLVMEYVEGIKITDRAALERAGIAPAAVARQLHALYAEQIFRLGWLHADPHPGNLLVQQRPEGPRIVLLDHGLTVPLAPALTQALGEMVRALLAGDFAGLTAALERAGMRLDPDVDLATLLGLVGVLLNAGGAAGAPAAKADALAIGRQLGHSIGHIPADLLLVGRALGLLDGTTKLLDPSANALESVAAYFAANPPAASEPSAE